MESLEPVLDMLLEVSQRTAVRVPTPSQPPESHWDAAADEYIRHSARSETFRKITPEVAAALIPRLLAAQRHARTAQEQLDASLGKEASAGELLEDLLLTRWQSTFKAEWEKSY